MKDEAAQDNERRSRSLSIRAKLTLWNLSAISFLLVVIAAGFYAVATKNQRKEIDRVLQLKLEYLKAFWQEAKHGPTGSPFRTGPGGQKARTSDYAELDSLLMRKNWTDTLVQVSDEDENVLYRSSSLQGHVLAIPSHQSKETFETVDLKGFSYPFRIVSFRSRYTRARHDIIQIGEPLKEMKQLQNDILWGGLIAIPTVLFIGTFIGLFLIRQTLKPVEDLAQQAQRISSESLSRRLPVISTDDEIGKLSLTLNDMIARLEHSIQGIHQFTADASHELRTPLTILQGEIELALKSMHARPCQGNSEDCNKIFQSNLEEVNHLSRIVHHLLTLSRFDSEQNKVEFHPVCIDDILNKIEEPARFLAMQKNQKFHFEKNEKAIVMADASHLQELFLNLVDNAIKYTSQGGKIALFSTLHDSRVVIKISDTGVGIPEDHLDQIFDRFFRVDKERSRSLGGTGLGLAICREIVLTHKGTIRVESKVGQGTTFTVTLPAITTFSS